MYHTRPPVDAMEGFVYFRDRTKSRWICKHSPCERHVFRACRWMNAICNEYIGYIDTHARSLDIVAVVFLILRRVSQRSTLSLEHFM